MSVTDNNLIRIASNDISFTRHNVEHQGRYNFPYRIFGQKLSLVTKNLKLKLSTLIYDDILQ